MSILRECGPARLVLQQGRQRKALAPLASGIVCATVWLFCLGPNVRHESDASAFGKVTQLLNQKVMTVVQTNFHGAKNIHVILPKVLEALKPYGLRPSVETCGISICPDEVNNEKTTLSTLLANHYGKVASTSGLGGMPFVGKMGFLAFSHHEPINGHIVVVFGPHLGLSSNGELGKLMRFGQAAVSNACSAASAAYGQLTSGETMMADAADAQLCCLGEQRASELENMAKSTGRMVELNFKLYEIIEKQMLTIANTNYGPGKVVLLGGITINMPGPVPGYFLPLHFSIRSEGQAPVDLMSSFV